jgi:hypothetical protein
MTNYGNDNESLNIDLNSKDHASVDNGKPTFKCRQCKAGVWYEENSWHEISSHII